MKNIIRIVYKHCVYLLLLVSLSACIFAPTIDSVRRAGLTEGSRQGLLPESLKNFNEALQWGSSQDAINYIDPEGQDIENMANQIQQLAQEEKVVESKILGIDFKENAFKAIVNVNVRAYKVPYYVVTDRKEKQIWKFSLSDGWKINSREVLQGQGKAKS
jgi:hypothetical protein